MGLQPPKYTTAQRAAIIHAVLDANPPSSVPDACKRAAAGELRTAAGERLDAWSMHPGTARDLVARERRRRDAARARVAGPDAGAREIAAAVLEEARDLTRRMKRRRAKLTPREIKDAASMARECLSLAREAGMDGAAPAPLPAAPAPADDAGALAAAAAEIAAQADPPPEPPAGEDGNHPGNGTPGNV